MVKVALTPNGENDPVLRFAVACVEGSDIISQAKLVESYHSIAPQIATTTSVVGD